MFKSKNIPPEHVENTTSERSSSEEPKEHIDWSEESVSSELGKEVLPQISDSHREYLLKRHGTIDLDPLPSEDPGDPLNWPSWKKNLNLVGVALQAMGGVLMCTTIIPSLITLSEEFQVEFTQVTYYPTVSILFLGVSTIFWKPVANRYGRRPVWLVSTFLSGIFSIASGFCNDYGSLMAMRVLCGISFAPALSIGGSTIGETFFSKDRAKKVGLWQLAFTIGPPIGAMFGGITLYHTGTWRWAFWILVIYAFFTFGFAILFCPETLYSRKQVAESPHGFWAQYFKVRRINKAKFTFYEFIEPYIWARYLPVFMAFMVHGMANNLTSPGITIILPKFYTEVYGLNPQQVGLQYIAMMIGLIIGDLMGGPLSDFLMNQKRKRTGHVPPEFRLWGGYFGVAIAVCGVLVYGIMLGKAEKDHWTVVPDVGMALAAVGNQLIAAVVITYAIDKMGVVNSGTVSNSIHQYRQVWGFLASLFFNPMYDNLGTAGAAGLMSGLIVFSAIPMVYMHIFGSKHQYNVQSTEAKSDF